MKKYLFLTLLLIILTSVSVMAISQRLRAAHWCFGNGCHIDFSSGSPVSVGESSVNTLEGVASMSDAEGNLLLYTDGMNVWNNKHQEMLNGWGLAGHSSSSQSAIIFPAPGDNENIYYLVTADVYWNNDDHSGLNYYVVDIAAQNGRGEVISKNNKLAETICEKVTAVGHTNGKDFWLVTQLWKKNVIQVFLVNEEGIALHGEYTTTIFKNYNNAAHTKGCIKFSADGTLLASANNGVGLFLFDFDRESGIVSNQRGWRDDEFRYAYGVEFSPTGRFLYFTSSAYNGNDGYGDYDDMNYVGQLDLYAGSNSDIKKSLTVLYSYRKSWLWTTDLGSVQLALDGKIYVCTGSYLYLGVVNDIEKKGYSCKFDSKGFEVDYGIPISGLPQIIQSYYYQDPGKPIEYDTCEGGNIEMKVEELANHSYRWTLPDGTVLEGANHTIEPTTRKNSGIYILTITYPDGSESSEEYEVKIGYLDYEISFLHAPEKQLKTQSENYNFLIKNKTDFDMIINEVYLKDNSKFKLNPVTLPLTVAANSIDSSITCYISRDKIGIYADDLVLKIDSPCVDETEIEIEGLVRNYFEEHDDCDDGTIHLFAEEMAGFSYNWTGPLGLDTDESEVFISPTTAAHSGKYTLAVTDPNGEVKTYDYDITIIELDLIAKLEEPEKTKGFVYEPSENYFYTIENPNDYDIVISNIKLAEGTDWKLNSVSIPLTIPAHTKDETSISCYLYSEVPGVFNDSLLVEVTKPCELFSNQLLSFEVEPISLYVQLPDTTCETSEYLRIPLRAKLNKLLPEGSKIDFSVTFDYLSKVYAPFNYQEIDSKIFFKDRLDNTYESFTATFKGLELNTVYQRIALINGQALHANTDYTPLTFDLDSSYSFTNYSGIQIVAGDGSLTTIRDTCVSNDISADPRATHTVIENSSPIGNEGVLELYSPDEGKLNLQIYNITGELVESFDYENSEVFYKDLYPDWTKYSNGTYYIVWSSPKRTFRKALIISK